MKAIISKELHRPKLFATTPHLGVRWVFATAALLAFLPGCDGESKKVCNDLCTKMESCIPAELAKMKKEASKGVKKGKAKAKKPSATAKASAASSNKPTTEFEKDMEKELDKFEKDMDKELDKFEKDMDKELDKFDKDMEKIMKETLTEGVELCRKSCKEGGYASSEELTKAKACLAKDCGGFYECIEE